MYVFLDNLPWLCPNFCAYLFLMDYCSSVNLHRFVKFTRVQILASFPFRCRNVSEFCADQHHGGIAIWKCSGYTGSVSNLFHDPFQGIARTQMCPMLIRKVHIRQGSFNGRFDEFSDLIQVHFPKFFGDKFCFFTCSHPVFLRMNRFQHCGNTFHMFPWTHRECIPIPVDNTALPLRSREKISDNSMQPEHLSDTISFTPESPRSFK